MQAEMPAVQPTLPWPKQPDRQKRPRPFYPNIFAGPTLAGCVWMGYFFLGYRQQQLLSVLQEWPMHAFIPIILQPGCHRSHRIPGKSDQTVERGRWVGWSDQGIAVQLQTWENETVWLAFPLWRRGSNADDRLVWKPTRTCGKSTPRWQNWSLTIPTWKMVLGWMRQACRPNCVSIHLP